MESLKIKNIDFSYPSPASLPSKSPNVPIMDCQVNTNAPSVQLFPTLPNNPLPDLYENSYISQILNNDSDNIKMDDADLLAMSFFDFDLDQLVSPAPPPSSPVPNQNFAIMDYLMNHNDAVLPINAGKDACVEFTKKNNIPELVIDPHVIEPEIVDVKPQTPTESCTIDQDDEREDEPEPADESEEESAPEIMALSVLEDPSSEEEEEEDEEDLESIATDTTKVEPIPLRSSSRIPSTTKLTLDDFIYDPSGESTDDEEDSDYSQRKRRKLNPGSHFPCPYSGCGKAFARKFNLKTHMKIHDSNRSRPFNCPHCSLTFIRQSDLIRHSVSHGKIKSFFCNGCNAGFTRRDALKRHMVLRNCGDLEAFNQTSLRKRRQKR